MTKVADLPRGWTLYASDECNGIELVPVFIHRDGRRRRAMEIAAMPEAPELFTAVKRHLDIADSSRRSFNQDTGLRGLEVAKLSLQFALAAYERWRKDLLYTGVEVGA